MKLAKGKGKKYFDIYCRMYSVQYDEYGNIDLEQMERDLKDFETKIKNGEIKC